MSFEGDRVGLGQLTERMKSQRLRVVFHQSLTAQPSGPERFTQAPYCIVRSGFHGADRDSYGVRGFLRAAPSPVHLSQHFEVIRGHLCQGGCHGDRRGDPIGVVGCGGAGAGAQRRVGDLGRSGTAGAVPVDNQVPGYRQQPGSGVAGALGEDLRVTPGPQEDFLGDVGGAVVVLEKKTGGVVQHDLPVLFVQGTEHGLVERLAARPARSGLERTLRPFTWFIPSGSGFLDRPRRVAGPAMLLWNTAHDAGGFR